MAVSVQLSLSGECAYLDLQDVVPTNAFVVHLVVGVICVSPRLVLDKGEAVFVLAGVLGAAHMILTVCWIGFAVQECRIEPGVHRPRIRMQGLALSSHGRSR